MYLELADCYKQKAPTADVVRCKIKPPSDESKLLRDGEGLREPIVLKSLMGLGLRDILAASPAVKNERALVPLYLAFALQS